MKTKLTNAWGIVLVFLSLCGSAIWAQGPVAHWKFDEGTGNLAYDSANANHGTIFNFGTYDGPAWVTGVAGTALSLDGRDDYVRIPHNPSLNVTSTGLSVCLWIKAGPDQFSSDSHFLIIDKSHTGSDATAWVMQGSIVYGGLAFMIGEGTPSGAPLWGYPGVGIANGLYLDNQWHHLAGTFNGSNAIKFYLDGVLQGTYDQYTGTPASNTRDVFIGAWSGGSTRRFHGVVDDVLIYNRALSAGEIGALQNPQPMPVASADVPVGGFIGEALAFDASASSDAEGKPLTYKWDFGDGTTIDTTVPVIEHTYATSGTYTVTLEVNNGVDDSAPFVAEIAISSLPPVALANGPLSGFVYMPVALDASASYDPEGEPLLYKWNFGDTTTLQTTSPVIEHTYAAEGVYTVTLVVNDGVLDSEPFVTVAAIDNRAPVALADEDLIGFDDGTPVDFDASASYDPESQPLLYKWDFGDGGIRQSWSPTYAYSYYAGIYTVTLVVNDGVYDSEPFTTTVRVVTTFEGGGQRSDVDAFLSFWSPTERSTTLPSGTTSFDVGIRYNDDIRAETFEATLNGEPFYGFTPVWNTWETVAIPLSPGRNTLLLTVEGRRSDGRTGKDRDQLVFIVE